MAARAGLTLANTSRHLQLLRRAALIAGRLDGKRVYYRLAGDDFVVGLLSALNRVGERNSAEIAWVIASCFRARGEFEPVTRGELVDRLRAGSAAVLDVRPEDEFSYGHSLEAVNIPLAQLERRLAELPLDQEIVAYCRGPWCVLLSEAVVLTVVGLSCEMLMHRTPRYAMPAAGAQQVSGRDGLRSTASM